MHQRRVKIFDTAGDSLSGFITIDSVATESTDLSDYILLGDNDFSIIRRAAPSDTMVVERFALDGSRISKPAFFLDHVSMNKCIGYAPVLDTIYHNRRADLTIAGLPDHTWLASWSRIQSDGTTDVYAGLFDEQFHPLGPAKRVNSDPTGNQSAPALAIDGDDACIAWVDGRSGEREIYLRRFRTNQILGAERTEAPAPVRITDIYPQPAKEYLTILYSHPSDAGPLKGTVTLFDALGRTVLHQPLPEGEEERRILLATDHLPAGLYLAALDFGTQRKGARILLVR
jgi:hypothetical protein